MVKIRAEDPEYIEIWTPLIGINMMEGKNVFNEKWYQYIYDEPPQYGRQDERRIRR